MPISKTLHTFADENVKQKKKQKIMEEKWNWKEKEYFEVSDLPKADREFRRIFKTSFHLPMDNMMSLFLFGHIIVDLPKLSDYFEAKDPEVNEKISLKEMCIKYGGEDGEEFIQKMMK